MFTARRAFTLLLLVLCTLPVIACGQSSSTHSSADTPVKDSIADSRPAVAPSDRAAAVSDTTAGANQLSVPKPGPDSYTPTELSPAGGDSMISYSEHHASQALAKSSPANSTATTPASAAVAAPVETVGAEPAVVAQAAPVPATSHSDARHTSPGSGNSVSAPAEVAEQESVGASGAQGLAFAQSFGPISTPMPPTAALGSGGGKRRPGATNFRDNGRIPAVATNEDAVSTFSLDTDRTSYRLALNWARQGYDVDPDSVRAEEWVNSFSYGYDRPSGDSEFAIYTEVYPHPLDGRKHMARVAFQAPDLRDDATPLNVTLVLDASGSMADGNRVAIARAAAESIRQSLRPDDRIAVVQFTDGVIRELTVEHTRPDDRSIGQSINRLQPNMATNVQAGLDLGVELADEARRSRPEAYNYVILMSDGVANVDATNPFAILDSAGDYNKENPIRLVTIGVGIANYNDYLLEQLAHHGNGWYRYLDDVEQARLTFSRENWLNLAVPFADQTRAQVTWNPEFVRTWRIVGYENRVTPDEFFTQDRKEFAEIPSGAATTVFYELELTDPAARRRGTDGLAKLGDVELRWVEPDSGRSRQQFAAVSGHWPQDFDALVDPFLKLGTYVALAADRYSALPVSGYAHFRSFDRELATLNERIWRLETELGHLTAFDDFTFLLDHMTRYAPVSPERPRDSGYSP